MLGLSDIKNVPSRALIDPGRLLRLSRSRSPVVHKHPTGGPARICNAQVRREKKW